MNGACANLPYQAELGMAETEAKRKLLAASMCFGHRRRRCQIKFYTACFRAGTR